VVQCPVVLAAPARTVALYPEADTQQPGSSATVTVSQHDGKIWAGPLGCFPAQDSQNSSNGASAFANATLPGLETDPAMAASQEAPQLYAERAIQAIA
jgi:hypothetical protein